MNFIVASRIVRGLNLIAVQNSSRLQSVVKQSKTKVLLVVRCRNEGWRGFYKGLSVNLTKVTPATVITLVVYEHVFHYLQSNAAGEEVITVPVVSKLKE